MSRNYPTVGKNSYEVLGELCLKDEELACIKIKSRV